MSRVRPAIPADAAEIGRIATANGQPPEDSGCDARYVGLLSRHGRVLVAEPAKTGGARPGLAGFAAIRPLGGITLLCDLFVDPARQGRGVGRSLLDQLFDGTTDRVTFSSQDPRALPLYVRYGLVPRWPLLYLAGNPAALTAPSPPVSVEAPPARQVTAQEAAAAELAFTGVDRGPDYSYWGGLPEGGGILVGQAGGVVAAGATGQGELRHLATAPGADQAAAVLAALRAVGQRRVMLCLPGPHPALGQLLRSGFRIDDFDHYMSTAEDLLHCSDVFSPALA
jgi:GNAT superfamily N-acetyltransferase